MADAYSSQPAPELGQEFIPADEPRQIEQLLQIFRSIQDAHDATKRPVPRTVHPKQHGCAHAEFTVDALRDPELAVGLFAEPRTFPALVRFSNAKQRDDRLPDGHGMAVKLFRVPGEKILEDERHATTQDFVLVDHPVFFARNTAELVPLAEDFRRLMLGTVVQKAMIGGKALLSPARPFRLLRQMGAKRPDNPLESQYHSTTAFRFGKRAAKYSLRPVLDFLPVRSAESRDKLRTALWETLRRSVVRFEFLVQLQRDPLSMPIEDPTVQWDLAVSPFQRVGELRIPSQHPARSGEGEFGEFLSFTPWHAVHEHRPLGGINRSRLKIYEAMASRRQGLNGAQSHEPTWEEVCTQAGLS